MATNEYDRLILTRTIGQSVQAARLALGLTRAEAAAKAGISLQYLARIERCTSMPSVKTLTKLIYALDMNPDKTLGIMPQLPIRRQLVDLPPELNNLTLRIQELPEGQVRAVMMLLKICEDRLDPPGPEFDA